MELPRALMPWAEWLDLFPTELIAPVGELVRRLDLAIGPLRTPTQPGQGEPNGFDGIARRGDYDRLLLSEWLLADEAPDEFLRRAAMNEHVFLEPARIAPAGARCSVALFDAGPNQLGAPRLAHLAALIVLARRAQAIGAQFQWGLLQEEERNLHSEVTRGSLSHLLKARSLREARDEDVAAWRVQAASLVGVEDCWLIGGKRLQELPSAQGARLLQVADPLEPESQFLNIRITHTASASIQPQSRIPIPHDRNAPSLMFFSEKEPEDKGKAIRLLLPPGDTCARLLREPFHTRVAELRRVKNGRKPVSNLVYVSENRIAARTAPDQIVVFSPPNTPTGNLAKPKLYSCPWHGHVLAVGKVGKGFALITTTQEANQLRITRLGPQSGRALTGTFAWPFPQISPIDAHDALATAYYKQDATGVGCWNLTLNHVQIQVSAGSEPDTLTARVARPNRAFAPVMHGNFLVGPEMAGIRMGLQAQSAYVPGISGGDTDTDIYAEFPTVQTAHYGFGGPLTHPVYGLWALEITPGQWKIVHQDGKGKEARTGMSEEDWGGVVGVVAVPGIEASGCGTSQYAPALVVLDMTDRIIGLQGKGWQRSEPPAAAPIEQITVSPFEPNVAYVTTRGEVVVYSLARQTTLYRLDTE